MKLVICFCCVILFTNSVKSQSMEKLYKNLQISFIVMDAKKYNNIYLPCMQSNSCISKKVLSDFLESLKNEDEQFERYQNMYFDTFDYKVMCNIQKKEAKNKILEFQKDSSSDAKSFIDEYFLFFSSALYFKNAWYSHPFLEFSENFYAEILKEHSSILMQHQNDSISSQGLFKEILLYPRVHDRLEKDANPPRYYLLTEDFVRSLLEEVVRNERSIENDKVKYEYDLFYDALNKAQKGEAYIIITSF